MEGTILFIVSLKRFLKDTGNDYDWKMVWKLLKDSM